MREREDASFHLLHSQERYQNHDPISSPVSGSPEFRVCRSKLVANPFHQFQGPRSWHRRNAGSVPVLGIDIAPCLLGDNHARSTHTLEFTYLLSLGHGSMQVLLLVSLLKHHKDSEHLGG